jgi:uncharacterized protein YcnI
MLRNWRAAAGAFVAGAAGAVVLAAPAAADVTVTPAVAPRGGPAALVFTVPEERAGAHTTKVELLVPEATPIGEIYPMSVTGWAPTTTTRKLDKPIELIHGQPANEVVSKVTWIRVGRAAPKPGEAALLKLSMGPMPQTEQVAFTIVQTYSDGTVVRWADAPAAGAKNPAPVVKLLSVSAADRQHGERRDAAAAGPQAPVAKAGGDGPSWLLVAGLLVAAIVAVEAWILFVARRRRTGAGAAPPSAAGSA